MRTILGQYAERLTPDERRAIWARVSRSRTGASRAWTRRAAPVLAAMTTVAVVMSVVAVLEREPVGVRRAATPTRVETPTADQAGVPAPAVVGPVHGERVHARGSVTARVAPPGTPPAPALGPHAADVPGAALTSPPAGEPSPVSIGSWGALSGRITDALGQPVAYANVIIVGTRMGAMSDEQGAFRIPGLPADTYSVQVMATGYPKEVREGIRVGGDQTATADFRLRQQRVVKEFDMVEVGGQRVLDSKSSTTRQTITSEQLGQLPVDNLRDAVATKRGVVSQGGEQHFRGGRGDEVKFQFDGAPIPSPATAGIAAPPPVIPTTGGTRLPNDEAFDSMFFQDHGVNPFIATDEDALSTFAVDVDAASYTVTRRYLGLGQLPPTDAVRVEEFVNFFPQGYPRFEHEDFRLLIDGAPSPFGAGYHLVRIGIKGREIVDRDRKPARLTFVIDVSGSMAREDRLELVKRALRLLVDQLHGDDRVGIVVYGSEGRVLLEPVALGGGGARGRGASTQADDREEDQPIAGGAGRQQLLAAIEQLRPEGSTNAEHGLRLGYEMARRAFRPDAINRIVLCSDGVANVGRTGPESILAQVRTEADKGIHLTTIGFGMGNYNDVLMEQLADRGDGNHYYVDDLDEARRVFVENLTGTLQTIAKDAKVQVEFDSTRVLRYRLLGFENRDVADRDFRNDKVDAGEIGAGHEVTALYEVKLARGVTRGTLATVRFRYARPEQEGAGAPQVREIERRFDAAALGRRFEDAAPRFRLDAAVAEFAEILRKSYWAKEGRLADVLSVARSAARDLRDDSSAEFVTLVEKAAGLKRRERPDERP